MKRLAAFLLAAALAGCASSRTAPPVTIPPPAPSMHLTRAAFADLPGWQTGDATPALSAFRRSCDQITKADQAKAMGGAGYAGTYADWQAVCHTLAQAGDARAFFENAFVPFAVTGGTTPEGLFTGYYEPELSASRIRQGKFQTPIYGLPSDLISVDLGAFRPNLRGERIAGRVEGQALVPYATRADIENKGLPTAQILFYAEDPVAVFFLHIQGSGRVRFDDGSSARVAYAGQNGQIYSAIGRTLIAEGALTAQNVSLQTIRDWLKANPGRAAEVMNTNASYVFFKEMPIGDPALGALGAENVPLTPGASLAVDLRLHPLGMPVFLASTMPDNTALNTLLVTQDTGGAIRGAVRGDVFWGTGARAEDLAGKMKQPGKLYVLLPKAVADKLGTEAEFKSP
jgi:membrane-bound lytic murein transglycosylase A